MANTPPILPVRFLGGSLYGGVQLVNTAVPVGTGATSVANSATTSVILPKPACTSCQLVGFRVDTLVAAVCASGTVLAQLIKRVGASTDTALTAATSLEADFVTVAQASYRVDVTATSIQNITFGAADVARIDIVTTNSVGTQPTATFTALWAIINP